MPRASRTVRVSSIEGETMRFRVESWSAPQKPHTVDLLAYEGAGECSCTDWSTRRGPAIKHGEPHGTPATCCRHVTAARHYFLNRLLREMAQEHAMPDARR